MTKYSFIIPLLLFSLWSSAQSRETTYDLLQYTPSIAYLSSSVFDTDSNFKEDATHFGMSFITMASTVKGLKHITSVERPDGSDFNSFPSGHSAVAFMGAELMRTKHKDQKALWISSYALASLIAVQRVQDRHHRPLEVLSGALIGIASVHLATLLKKQFHKTSKRSSTN